MAGAPAAFVAMLAGPALPGDHILRTQIEARMRSAGQPPEKIAQNNTFVARLISASMQGDGALREEAEEIAAEIGAGKAWTDAQIAFFGSPWLRQFLVADPAPALAELQVPVLALFGDKDIQVDGAENAAAARAALSSNGDARVIVLDQHNHLFQQAQQGTGLASGPAPSEQALDLLADWISANPPRETPCGEGAK